MNEEVDFCILGGGLAGLSMADALQEKGFRVAIVDIRTPGAGASGTPGGLVNPATGRFAVKAWNAEGGYKAILENFQKVRDLATEPFFWKNGILRPALSEKQARRMRKQFEETAWPEGWCHWLTEANIKEMHPGINCVMGGLWIPVGLTVNVGAYLVAYARYLARQDVMLVLDTNADVSAGESDSDRWVIHTPDLDIRVDHLIYATGIDVLQNEYWNNLPLHPVKGQVVQFCADPGILNFSHSVSSLGYIARTGPSNCFVQGSTYEHNFNDRRPDANGIRYLKSRLEQTLPALSGHVTLIGQWAGVRASTPDRKPILGKHPTVENLHVFTGLGSKGLLFSKFLALHYAEYLTGNADLFDAVALGRFL